MANGIRLQSAMEYLMTYGWAILVIAIVLGVLYYLGVFNGINTVPRAQPGSCNIFRPNGAGTSYDVNFQGECQGQLPEFVAQFNGQTSSTTFPTNMVTGGQFTYAIWVRYLGPSSNQWPFLIGFNSHYYSALRTSGFGSQVYLEYGTYPTCNGASYNGVSSITISNGAWYQFIGTWNGSAMAMYENGVKVAVVTGITGQCQASTPPYLGGGGGAGVPFNGLMANAQIYNTSLSQTEVSALYNEGIGGAPVRPQNLVAWWPLNSNVNDYSGNEYNGQSSAVSYVSNWTAGYTGPGAP